MNTQQSQMQQGSKQSASAINSIDPVRLLRTYWPILVIAGILALGAGIGLNLYLARNHPKYTAEALLLVRPPQVDVVIGAAGGTGEQKELLLYMETQRQIITDVTTLRRSLADPEARRTSFIQQFVENGLLIEDEAVQALSKAVGVGIGNTQIITVRSTLGTRDEAATITNAVTQAYLAQHRQSTSTSRQVTASTLDERIRTAQTRIETLEAQMENLLTENNLTTTSLRDTEAFITLANVKPKLAEVRQLRAAAQDQLETYRDHRANQTFPESIREQAEFLPGVRAIEGRIDLFEADLEANKQAFGREHRSNSAIERQLQGYRTKYRTKIEEEMAGLFEAQIQGLENAIAGFNAEENELLDQIQQADLQLQELNQELERHQQLAEERASELARRNEFEAQREAIGIIGDVGSRVSLFRPAEPPRSRSFPKLPIVAGGSVFVVLALVSGLILLREILESRIRFPQDVFQVPKTRLLGFLPTIEMDPARPKRAEFASIEASAGSYAEQTRQLRTTLMDVSHERGHKSILVAAGLPGSGASSFLTNLAITLAAADNRVLIIDGNLRRPAQHSLFDLPEGPGLAEVLRGRMPLSEAVRQTSHDDVSVLVAGSPGPDRASAFERFATPAMAQVIELAKESYDFVLIDTPPIVVSSDAAAIAKHADASLALVRAFREKRGLLARLRNVLVASDSEFLGVIVNGVKPAAGGYYRKNFAVAAAYSRRSKSESDRAQPVSSS